MTRARKKPITTASFLILVVFTTTLAILTNLPFAWIDSYATEEANDLSVEEIDVDFEDEVGPGQHITCNPEVLVYTYECDPASHQWLKSKGIDITAAPPGFLYPTYISGTWQTGAVIGYSSSNDGQQEEFGGLDIDEVLAIHILNGLSNQVDLTLTTVPTEEADSPSAVILKAFDSDNNMISSTTETFQVVSGNTYSPAIVSIAAPSFSISYLTLQAIEYPEGGLFIKGLSFARILDGEIEDLPPAITTTLPSDIITLWGENLGGGEEYDYFDELWLRAYDDFDGPLPLSCNPTPGSFIKTGFTEVTCRAVDSKGQTSEAWFFIRVVDYSVPESTAPLLYCRIDNENGPIVDPDLPVPIGSNLFCYDLSVHRETYFNTISANGPTGQIGDDPEIVEWNINSIRFQVDEPGTYTITGTFLQGIEGPVVEIAELTLFTSDNNHEQEPAHAKVVAFQNGNLIDIDAGVDGAPGSDIDCVGAIDIDANADLMKCYLLSDDSIWASEYSTDPSVVMQEGSPIACAVDAGFEENKECFSITFDGNRFEEQGRYRFVAEFYDGNTLLGIAGQDYRLHSFFILPESAVGAIAMVGTSFAALGGFLFLRSRK